MNKVKFENSFHFEKKLSVNENIHKTIFSTYLLGNGINQCERLSMSQSIEVRLPFLQKKIVQLFSANENNQKGKKILKDILIENASSAFNKLNKIGFSPPSHIWKKIIIKYNGHLLKDGKLISNRIIKKESTEKIIQKKYDKSTISISYKLIVLEIFLRKYLL